MKVPILGGAYQGRSSNVSAQTCINWYYEKGVDGEALVPTPGATLFCDAGDGEVRGGLAYNNRAYFVAGNKLVEVDSAGTATERGTLNTTSGRVSMAHNGTRAEANQQIMIVDGSEGYIYDNTTSTLSQISDTDMVASDSVLFLDGYFVFSQKNTDRFWITGLYDGTTVNENDFATAEGNPDIIRGLASLNRDLHIFGKVSREVWYNAGDADNTFQRYQGGASRTGAVSGYAISLFDNSIGWVTENEDGDSQVARMGEGYQPTIISTPEINYQLSTYSTVADAFSYVYQVEGHEFMVITFPTAKATWVYDASTQQWHRRGHVIDGVFPNRERFNCHVFAFGRHLMGDFENGKIYALDSSVGTIDGERIPRERTTSNLAEEEKRLRLFSFQLDMEEGTGESTDDDDTSVYLSYSKDGGHTFSNEIARSFGDEGAYTTRLIWRRLGHARNWTFRVKTWSPRRVIIKGAYVKTYGER